MADHSRIEWTEATWNPIAGCSLVSPGCTHCYAMKDAHRLAGNPNPRIAAKYAGTTKIAARGGEAKGRTGKRNVPVWTGRVNVADDQVLTQPLRWQKPRRIFVNSMSDLFHADVPDAAIDRIFAVMALTPLHTFQVLTKRAERMRAYLSAPDVAERVWKAVHALADLWADGGSEFRLPCVDGDPIMPALAAHGADWGGDLPWPLANVWLGVSAEDQTRADERVPVLLDTPAAVRWVSAEPLLGPIDFTRIRQTWFPTAPGRPATVPGPSEPPVILDALTGCRRWPSGDLIARRGPHLDWIVAGGESGVGARPMHPAWVRSIRDQCARASVPFHFKHWGQWATTTIGNGGRLDPPLPINGGFKDIRLWAGDLAVRFAPDAMVDEVFKPGNRLTIPVGKKRAGRLLDGVTHDGFPARPA